jgi:hypothetical protein
MVCQNYWLPAEKNHLAGQDFASENSFVSLVPLFF